LLDEREVLLRVDLVPGERREEGEFVASEPHGDLPAPEIRQRLDAGRLEGELPHQEHGRVEACHPFGAVRATFD
jgi:hypothetical protein